MAKRLEISGRNMRRYVAGELPIPRVVELAALCLAEHSSGQPGEFNGVEPLYFDRNKRGGRFVEIRGGKLYFDIKPLEALSPQEGGKLRGWLDRALPDNQKGDV